jgi:hypothetical protein
MVDLPYPILSPNSYWMEIPYSVFGPRELGRAAEGMGVSRSGPNKSLVCLMVLGIYVGWGWGVEASNSQVFLPWGEPVNWRD